MDMLNKFHEWLEDKTCRLRGDQQLDHMIRLAYRQVEPPTPADDLRAKLLARAENMSQLAPLPERAIVSQAHKTPALSSDSNRDTHKYLAWRQQNDYENVVERHRSHQTRQAYRQIMDYAMHQMRLNLIDSNIYFI